MCRQQALISDFLDLAKLSMREQAALAMNWIKDRPEGLMLQNLALATMTSHAISSLPENTIADVQHAINKCETLGSGKQLSHHGNPSAIARDFSPHMAALRRHFVPNMQFECCLLPQAPSEAIFDMFAASGESTAWVLLWKTRSRPTGVRVCPEAQFNIFSTAFDSRAWTGGCVLEKEILGRQPQPITPGTKQDMGPIIHLRQPSLMILMFLLDLVDLRNLLDSQVYHLLVIEKEWNLEVHRVSDCL